MFLSDESAACIYINKPNGQAIAQLVYQESFWIGVQKVCAISQTLLKVIRLFDGDKPTTIYLYEAMDRANEVTHRYYKNKGEGFTKRSEIWKLIDEQRSNTLHHPIHVVRVYFNPAFFYSYRFRFDAKVMSGFLQIV